MLFAPFVHELAEKLALVLERATGTPSSAPRSVRAPRIR
jgi:hypothetical protein